MPKIKKFVKNARKMQEKCKKICEYANFFVILWRLCVVVL